jgi:CRISPR system Cascade subunit CasA
LQAISDSSPLVTAALHRLLLAILHRCFGPATPEDWAVLWRGRDKGFPMDRIRSYLLAWRHRFDLFDEARPFYQTAKLRSQKRKAPASKLLPELASGNNATLFDHTCDAEVIALGASGHHSGSGVFGLWHLGTRIPGGPFR